MFPELGGLTGYNFDQLSPSKLSLEKVITLYHRTDSRGVSCSGGSSCELQDRRWFVLKAPGRGL